jgi:tuftelin-interacting protein 11
VLTRLVAWQALLSTDVGDVGGLLSRRLTDEVLLPWLRLTASQWRVRQPVKLVELMTRLQETSLLSPPLFHACADELVAARLCREVDAWRPHRDDTAVNDWLLPWRHVLPTPLLAPLYAAVCAKLSSALQPWQASDASAVAVVAPWRGAFAAKDFDALFARCIAPKLTAALRDEFEVNPRAQRIEPFEWTVRWAGVASRTQLLAVLADTNGNGNDNRGGSGSSFWAKWVCALHAWLASTDVKANATEVIAWYRGWRAAFPPALRNDRCVTGVFEIALTMMNVWMDGSPLPPAAELVAKAHLLAAPPAVPKPAQSPPPRSSSSSSLSSSSLSSSLKSPMSRTSSARKSSASRAYGGDDARLDGLSLKEMIAKVAERHNVTFLPNMARALHDGKRVYSFGSTSVYLDGQNIFAWEKAPSSKASSSSSSASSWRPISIDTLLERQLQA